MSLNENELDEYMLFVMKLSCTKFDEDKPYTWHIISEYGEDEHFYCPECDAERKCIANVRRDEYHGVEHLGYVTLRDILEKVRKE